MIIFRMAGKDIKVTLYPLVIFAAIFVTCKGELCTQNIDQSSAGNQCIFHYSYQCNRTQSLQFNYCTYNVCYNQTQSNSCPFIVRTRSKDFTNCTNTCIIKVSDNIVSKNWLAITLIVFSTILVVIFCGCIGRRCWNNDPVNQNQFIVRMRPPSADENQLDSDRRMSSWNYLDFELKWVEQETQSQWIENEDTCVVCLENGLNCCLPCRHYFHKACIKEWLRLKTTCPTCKAESFDQLTIRCKGCKAMKLVCFIEQLKSMEIEEKCPNCK